MDRTQQLEKLFDILVDLHTARNNMHPKVAAQYHVEGFVARHKNDKYFDQLLQEEIEDCSRPSEYRFMDSKKIMSKTYNISVTYEIITDESAEKGDAAERGYERERVNVELDELERMVRNYGFSEPSSSYLEDRMWFSTTSPREDLEYFANGERKFFSLHLHAVNGEPPTLEDYADIARMANINIETSRNATPTPPVADRRLQMHDLNSYIVDGAGYCGSTQHTCDHLAKRLAEIAASLDPNSPPPEHWVAALIGDVEQQRDSIATRLDRVADGIKELAATFRAPQVDERNSPKIGWDANHSLL